MLWKNGTFQKMLAAYGISSFGDWFDMVAVLILFSFQWQADPMLIAMVPVMFALPSIFLGQFAGVLADRVKKQHLMIAADVLRGALTLLLFLAPNPYWALPILLLRSTAGIFNTPAQQALLRAVVPEEHLLRANVTFGMVYQMAKVIAPMLGSVVVGVLSVQACLLINAASFLLSAVLLMMVGRVPEEERVLGAKENRSGFFGSWKEGWHLLFSTRLLLASTLFYLCGYVGLQLVEGQISVLLREVTPDRPELVGYLVTAVGAGTFLVGGLMTRKKDIRSYGLPIAGGNLLIGTAFIGFGLYQAGTPVLWLLAAGLVTGIGTGFSMIAYNYMRQRETPPDMIGRMTGITNSLTSLMVIVGPTAGSVMARTIGVGAAFLVAGGLLAALGCAGLLLQNRIWGPRPHRTAHSEPRDEQEKKGAIVS